MQTTLGWFASPPLKNIDHSQNLGICSCLSKCVIIRSQKDIYSLFVSSSWSLVAVDEGLLFCLFFLEKLTKIYQNSWKRVCGDRSLDLDHGIFKNFLF